MSLVHGGLRTADTSLTDGTQKTSIISSVNMESGGKVSIGTSAVEMTFTGTTTSVILTADLDNTGTLYVGKSDVTNLGANAITYLLPGDSLTISYDDTDNAVYVVGSEASQNVWKGALL